MLSRVMVVTNLPRHPKLFALAAEARVGWAAALGYLVALWAEVMVQREGGRLDGWTRTDVERLSGWRGRKGVLVNALAKTGWVDVLDGGLISIHDWEEHQGNIIAERRLDAARKRIERAHKKGTHCKECPDVCRTSDGRHADGPGMSAAPLLSSPIPSSPLPSLPKRREEEDPASPPPAPVPPVLEVLEGGLRKAAARPAPPPRDDSPMLPATPEGLLYALARRQCIQAKDDTLRTYLRGWIKQKGAQEVERILMEDRVVGKGILAIQDWYFNEMGGSGFLGEVKR